MTGELKDMARDGVLRAAVNTGNRALVQVRDDGTFGGVAPALAQRLADEIGVPLEPVVYSGAGNVFADAGGAVWDLGFLAIDPSRAERVTFTRPYIVIEASFAVRADSPLKRAEDHDEAGLTVLSSTGSAYELYLTANLKNAALERSGTPGESFEEFRAGRGDMVAGVRESLERHFGGDPAYRVLPGALTRIEQALVLPTPGDPRQSALDDFLARAIEEGFVAEQLTKGDKA